MKMIAAQELGLGARPRWRSDRRRHRHLPQQRPLHRQPTHLRGGQRGAGSWPAPRCARATAEAGHRRRPWSAGDVSWSDGLPGAWTARALELAQAARRFLSKPLEVEGSVRPAHHTSWTPRPARARPTPPMLSRCTRPRWRWKSSPAGWRCCAWWPAHDVGKVIHPVNLEAQIQGAAMMGLGYAVSEEVRLDKGRIVNPHFLGLQAAPLLARPRSWTCAYGGGARTHRPLRGQGRGRARPAVHRARRCTTRWPRRWASIPIAIPVSSETLWQILDRQRPAAKERQGVSVNSAQPWREYWKSPNPGRPRPPPCWRR